MSSLVWKALGLVLSLFKSVVKVLQVCGRRVEDGKTIHLWARHEDGALAMDATATVA